MENKKNKNDKIYKDYRFKQVGMILQVILVVLILLFAILSIFNSFYLKLCSITTGLALLVMGYNNYKVYKRKSFTIIYIIIGLLVLLVAIFDLIK